MVRSLARLSGAKSAHVKTTFALDPLDADNLSSIYHQPGRGCDADHRMEPTHANKAVMSDGGSGRRICKASQKC
jgi:hypothetical protein